MYAAAAAAVGARAGSVVAEVAVQRKFNIAINIELKHIQPECRM